MQFVPSFSRRVSRTLQQGACYKLRWYEDNYNSDMWRKKEDEKRQIELEILTDDKTPEQKRIIEAFSKYDMVRGL